MIDPDTMQAWTFPGPGGRGSGSGGNIPNPNQSADVKALEVRLRSLFVGELEARVVVAVCDAVAPIMRDVEALRAEVERLSVLHPKGRVTT